ncbi:MAG TPA: Gfo/Idh/MocA family oxidoreductase [Bacteriovoracaceae bacterium]|nr:Gfo/Idh/MocA family oxidoreductase [Bacteriovoracaceae bacterium]
MKKIRVAVLGYGHLGKWHCQKVDAHPDQVEFVAIVENFAPNKALAQAAHPKVRVVDEISEVISGIDAAIVVTPTSTHFELVKYLLEQGKHVFCEKPLCSHDPEGKTLREIAQGKAMILQVGHSERFHQAWEKLRTEIHSLAAPFTVRINRIAPFKGRATDVDVVQDLAIHDLDLLMFLFKQRPLQVTATGQKIRTSKWDHANIHVKLEQGCHADIVVSRNHVQEIRNLEIVSGAGTLLIDLFSNKILRAPAGQFDDGTFVKEENYPKRDHLLIEHQHFYQSIAHQAPSVVGLFDGLNAVHLVDVTLRSMAEASTVDVRLHG